MWTDEGPRRRTVMDEYLTQLVHYAAKIKSEKSRRMLLNLAESFYEGEGN
jgi:hypothetical protein